MCRIYGHFGGEHSANHLRTVALLQRHGGPDAQYLAAGDDWALGNNRLAIMDLDHGDQPYTLGDRIKVVFNGEIYNHHELRARLRSFGYTFHDHCDGSILPALYDHYGEGFAEHLDGMFAIAVLDLHHEPTLVLATDQAGMKPLYYRWDRQRGTFHFSSELPALLSLPGISWDPWLPGLDAYLASKTPFGEQTMVDSVQVLPRATTASFTAAGGLRTVRRADATSDERFGDLESAGARLQEVLREQTRLLALADVPISAITSGGLDSSLVTALLAETVSDLTSFNIAYQGDWPFDERHFAREVAERHGTRYHQVVADPARFPELLHDVVWHLGQPNADPISISTYLLFQAVRDAGFKVAVTGDAADEIFGGYGRIKQALLDGEGDWAHNYLEALAAIPGELRRSLYTDDYRAYLTQHGGAYDTLRDTLGKKYGETGDRLAAITAFEVDERLPAYHLRRVDHLSMASSVEVRLPFCQPAVTRFALGLPEEFRVRGQEGKRALYQAARGLLPDSVLNRPKQPFTLPITAMLRPGEALLDHARETLSPAALRAGGQLDATAVQNLIDSQIERPSDTSALAIWSLMVHQIWREQLGTPRTGALPVREAA
ncbi:asparagine synthase (glutamine-hydrolyzing) [Streptomyces sp. CBMA156]|uniref:asparagine synthase (glutamine-hydrolyzing) n=1 Tax=Streptomyces sp. CBMA156 TaxID=1930280 RepID=UPI001661DD7B|nr:asparagine synthase (glutamine-hydrolyzing) [Streptomyces sp. CBMA156]MBD0673173.1 asparagine synthase (glutamine-hydrolyzing) [Streptomyces sp. CBMA156]